MFPSLRIFSLAVDINLKNNASRLLRQPLEDGKHCHNQINWQEDKDLHPGCLLNRILLCHTSFPKRVKASFPSFLKPSG